MDLDMEELIATRNRCKYCRTTGFSQQQEISGKYFDLIPTAGFGNDRHYTSWIMKCEDDEKAGIMIATNGGNAVFFNINYCPICR